MSIAFGTTFLPVRLGHLSHHKFSRHSQEQVEVYTDKCTLSFRLFYYFVLLGGLYLAELVLPLLTLLPYKILNKINTKLKTQETIASFVFNSFISDSQKLHATRVDAIAVISYLSLSFYLYADNYHYLLLFYLCRAMLISFFDYVYHYGTKLNDNKYALDIYLPRTLELFYLNFNLHGVHHIHPKTPWY